MKYIGEAIKYLNIRILRNKKKGIILLYQQRYIEKIFKIFKIQDLAPINTLIKLGTTYYYTRKSQKKIITFILNINLLSDL